MGFRELPADSFERSALREFGAFAFGVPTVYAIPVAAGDYAAVRNRPEAAIKRGEALKPATPSRSSSKTGPRGHVRGPRRRLVQPEGLRRGGQGNQAGHRLPATPSEAHGAGRARRERRADSRGDDRRAAGGSEAQQLVEPALKLHRGLVARGSDDLSQRVQLARALYASALGGGAQKRRVEGSRDPSRRPAAGDEAAGQHDVAARLDRRGTEESLPARNPSEWQLEAREAAGARLTRSGATSRELLAKRLHPKRNAVALAQGLEPRAVLADTLEGFGREVVSRHRIEDAVFFLDTGCA